MRKLKIMAFLVCITLSVYADVVLNGLFIDHMVLQRDIPVSVFGIATSGEKVTVNFASQEKSVIANKDGLWSVKLDAMKASTNPDGCNLYNNEGLLDAPFRTDEW